MKKYLRNILLGGASVREYCTITVGKEIEERVLLRFDGQDFDISHTHWLLCLDPLTFGIWFDGKKRDIHLENKAIYQMRFMDSALNGNDVADLTLEFVHAIEEEDGTLLILKLKQVRIHHIPFIKSRLLYYRYYKKPEQDFFKLKSFSAAYSYPRKVRLVSFQEGTWYNIFPMDLVGDIPSSRRYVFGLRHSNVTLERILATGKIVVSEVPYAYKDVIYQLGKHHRMAMSDMELPFEVIRSEIFGFPVPVWSNSYKEIQVSANLNLGSHMLIWGLEINQKFLNDPKGHLFHIHFLHYLHQKKRGLNYQPV